MKALVPIIIGILVGLPFYALGVLVRWAMTKRAPSCRHQWRILIEKYPRFTQDRWICDECKLTQNFPHDAPPVNIITDVCSMGHVHVSGYEEWDEWPEYIGAKEGRK